jgi:peptidoglycan/LPS O-acetylase OafA/YrhL
LSQSQDGNRLISVDLLRIFAALAITLFHLAYFSWSDPQNDTATVLRQMVSFPELVSLRSWTWVGVPIFFVLSGFVIAYSASSATALSYAQSRFLRLAPALWICATITLIAALLVGWSGPTNGLADAYLRSMTLWPGALWIDGVYWTLGIEVAFYLLVFALLLLRRFDWLQAAMIAVAFLSGATLLLRAAKRVGFDVWAPTVSRFTELLLLDHGVYFALGVFIWLAALRGRTPVRVAMVLACVSLGVVGLALDRRHDGITASTLWLASVAFLWIAVHWQSRIEWIGPRARWTIAILGLATYPLYLLHNIVGAAIMRGVLLLGADRFIALAVAILAVVVLSVTITLTIEPKTRSFLRNRLAPRVPKRSPDQASIVTRRARALN